MVSKKMTAMLMIAMLSFLASSVMVQAATSEVWDYSGDYDDEMDMSVEATTTAKPGDTIAVTVNYEAQEDLTDVKIYVSVQGTISKGTDTWTSDEEKVVKGDLDDGDDGSEDFDFDVDSDSDPGMILGHITASWTYDDGSDEYDRTLDLYFPVTYISGGIDESTYTALQTKYTQLETKYNTLDNNYSTLEEQSLELSASYDQLETSYNTINTNYEALQTTLEGLTSDYNTLESDLSALETQSSSLQTQLTEAQNNYNTANTELANTRNYMYIFIVTTIIGLGAAIVMAMRGKK